MVVGLLLCSAEPVLASSAGDAGAGSPVVVAGISKYLQGLATRERVIQICVIVMCLALFILMKKFTDDSSRSQEPGIRSQQRRHP
jgi:hypothetical protein